METTRDNIWQEKLADRYILDPALEMGWEFMAWYGQPGWSFPLYNADGQKWLLEDGREARRWKAMDSTAQYKYAWGYPDMPKDSKKKPDHCDYYWTPKPVRKYIANAQGTLHIACGEPDMLTLIAMGFYNVTSFFGEGNIPHNFVANMNSLGVKRIVYYPDTDAAGFTAAQKLHDTLYNTGVEFICKRLPVPENGDKQDLNSLLQSVGGNRAALHTMFADLPVHRFVAPQTVTDEPKQTKRKDFDRAGYDAALERFYTEIENALGVQKYSKDNFSNYVSCIFRTHERDSRSPRGTWHKDNHTFTCFKCGQTWKGDEVANHLGIALVQWQDFMPKGDKAQEINEPPPVYSSDDALNRYRDRLLGKHVSSVPPVPFPFSTMHHLEGFARLMKPRKLTAVLGLSGGGKTSFMEVAGDNLRRSGIDILWWGPEWSWEEMADRAVQRYGGLTMTEMMLHETALSEASAKANGKPATQFGSLITDSDPRYQKTLDTLDMIQSWYGKSFYIDKMGLNLPALLDTMQTTIDEKRAIGRDIRVVVFDYVQLLQVSGAVGEMERINRAVSLIKTFCADTNMIGIISTQPRKNDSSKAKENTDNEFNPALASESAKFLVDHEFNLFITLNPIYQNGQLTNKGILNITKNSGGKTGNVPVYIDFRHLAWLDKRLSTRDELNLSQTVDLRDL